MRERGSNQHDQGYPPRDQEAIRELFACTAAINALGAEQYKLMKRREELHHQLTRITRRNIAPTPELPYQEQELRFVHDHLECLPESLEKLRRKHHEYALHLARRNPNAPELPKPANLDRRTITLRDDSWGADGVIDLYPLLFPPERLEAHDAAFVIETLQHMAAKHLSPEVLPHLLFDWSDGSREHFSRDKTPRYSVTIYANPTDAINHDQPAIR